MNRVHAEHILDAYVQMRMREFDPDASDALREVILDAMTEYKISTGKVFNGYGITVPCGYPTNWDGTPKVTCTGVDPAFKTNTAVISE